MSDWQKIAIGVGAALVVGLVAGYSLGVSGKSELRKNAEKARKAMGAIKAQSSEEVAEAQAASKKALRTLALLRAKEQLLRASVQLNANNFGIASQRLGAASIQLKKAQKQVSSPQQKQIETILTDIGRAHALSMRLDATVRVHLERIVELVDRLPGAR